MASNIKTHILKEGWVFEAGDRKLGPYSMDEMNKLDFVDNLAASLLVEPKEIQTAKLRELTRPVTIDEVLEIISTTVKRDNPTKAVIFFEMLLTYTEEDQGNIALQAESSSGKSYIPLELSEYFPREDVIIYGGASPTALFHEAGLWDKERKVIHVDLERKILIFLDQPHYMLLERLRPLLSHDRKELVYKITDKSERHGLRTKTVIIKGYPTIIFCAAKFSMDEQERTRVFILSPDTSEDKLIESLYLLAKKHGDRDAFNEELHKDARRVWLKQRVATVKTAGIRNVVIENPDALCKRFIGSHNHLAPRHQRDFPRLIGLIKAHALPNYAHREQLPNNCIKASDEDVEAGFKLYNQIATPNELGISPRIWEIYEQVIKPLFKDGSGVDKKAVMNAYRLKFHRSLSFRALRDEILPTLEGVGLIIQDYDPEDKRRTLIYPTDARDISTQVASQKNMSQGSVGYEQHINVKSALRELVKPYSDPSKAQFVLLDIAHHLVGAGVAKNDDEAKQLIHGLQDEGVLRESETLRGHFTVHLEGLGEVKA